MNIAINLYNFSPEYKNTNLARPGWIQPLLVDVFKSAKNNQTAISDDIVSDVVPFIGWYAPDNINVENLNINPKRKLRRSI